MENKVFDFLDDFARLCPSERKYSLAENSSYFEIYVFTKESLDIVKEVDTLDFLSVEHELKKEGYGEFCTWINSEDRSFVFNCSKTTTTTATTKNMSEFDICYQSLKDFDTKGSSTLSVTGRKISTFYYFTDENIDLKERLQYLDALATSCDFSQKGCKLPFCMQTSDAEGWSNDYVKRVEFVLFK